MREADFGTAMLYSAVPAGNDGPQHSLAELERTLSTAENAAGGDRSRAMFWFFNEPLQEFGDQTPAALVRAGREQLVVDYMESVSGGACG